MLKNRPEENIEGGIPAVEVLLSVSPLRLSHLEILFLSKWFELPLPVSMSWDCKKIAVGSKIFGCSQDWQSLSHTLLRFVE
jgi:hypothetical protein